MTQRTARQLAQVRGTFRLRPGDVVLEAVRATCALLALVTLATSEVPAGTRAGMVLAHELLLVGVVVVLLLLPVAVRHGWADRLVAASTMGTLAFFVAYSALWHDVPHGGTLIGVLALVEAPVRYGVRGLAWSVPPVTIAALLWPQADASGYTSPPVMVLLLVTVLCGVVLLVREATARSARALASASEGFAEALLHLPLGVGLLDEDGRVVQANPALVALLGDDLEADLLLTRWPADSRGDLAEVLSGHRPELRVEAEGPGGRVLEVGARRLRARGPRRTVVHVHDVTSASRERADLLHASRHDALTGLLLRSAGERVLEEALRPGPGAGSGRAVLFVDLDGFKRLNDSAGHAVGDAVLRQAAARLSGALRPGEQAVRWGGDEFVVVCHDVHEPEQLDMLAQRLLHVLREPFRVDDQPLVTLSGSVGAVLARPGDDPATVVAVADQAMYEAKARGGDRWVCGTVPDPALVGVAAPAPLQRASRVGAP
jgi:diguanylate cyclase (GGDEF)-like protein